MHVAIASASLCDVMKLVTLLDLHNSSAELCDACRVLDCDCDLLPGGFVATRNKDCVANISVASLTRGISSSAVRTTSGEVLGAVAP